MLKKIFSMILVSLILCSACGSGGNSGSKDGDYKTIEISSSSSDVIIDESNINVVISGMSNDIHILEGNYINHMLITGMSNEILIDPNVTFGDFICEGMSNRIYIPLDSGITIQNTGSSNHIEEYE